MSDTEEPANKIYKSAKSDSKEKTRKEIRQEKKQKWKDKKEKNLLDEVEQLAVQRSKEESKEQIRKSSKKSRKRKSGKDKSKDGDDEKSQKSEADSQESQPDKETKKGRPYTMSIAIPGSILDNAQSIQLRSYLAGQIARALTIYNVDEVIIFDEDSQSSAKENLSTTGDFQGIGRGNHCCVQLGRILQYLECPQYLRKYLFKKHKDLEFAGLCNPLDATHHLRESMYCEYREGFVMNRPVSKQGGSYADVGLRKDCRLDIEVEAGSRVTVKMLDDHTIEKDSESSSSKSKLRGIVVSPSEPRQALGHYWGYTVRLAESLSDAIIGHPEWTYDLTVGTSERGTLIEKTKLPRNKSHILIVIGGVKGLEHSLEGDIKLTVASPKDLFDYYVNVCPDQGSRTIRTEEAMLIILASLRTKLFVT